MYEAMVPEINTFVLADKVSRLTSSGHGYYSQSYANGLYSCYGSSRLYKLQCKEMLISYSMDNDFSVPHQCHCREVIVISNPGFFELIE